MESAKSSVKSSVKSSAKSSAKSSVKSSAKSSAKSTVKPLAKSKKVKYASINKRKMDKPLRFTFSEYVGLDTNVAAKDRTCHYCKENNKVLIHPCSCKYAHDECLRDFLRNTPRINKHRCEVCKGAYVLDVRMKDIMNLI